MVLAINSSAAAMAMGVARASHMAAADVLRDARRTSRKSSSESAK
jgi:hypothetical protein